MFSRRFSKFLSNLCAMGAAFLIAYVARVGWDRSETAFVNINDGLVIIYLFFSYLLTFLVYRPKEPANSKFNVSRFFRIITTTVVTVAMVAGVFAVIIYATKSSTSIPRMFFVNFFSLYFGFEVIFEVILQRLYRRYQERHKKRAVVYTDIEDLMGISTKILEEGADDYEIPAVVRVAEDGKERVFLSTKTGMEEGDTTALTYLKRHQVDSVILAFEKLNAEKIRKITDRLAEMGIMTMITLDSFNIGDMSAVMEEFGSIPVVRMSTRIFSKAEIVEKRLLDVLVGFVGTIVCVLVGILVAPVIFLEDRGPIVFRQKRVGQNGKYFYIFKFRSMRVGAEAEKKKLMSKNEMKNEQMFKMKNDPRVTRVGKIIRKTSIDELPQFFNVLRGEMSVVGYRPPTVEEYKTYNAGYKRRMMLKPGLTGLWQVNGRSEITDFKEVLRYDNYYIDHWSIWMDIKIILKTIPAVISGRGSE